MQLAAHVSRATTLTEWLDPSVLDETDPSRRDPELDLYGASGPKPPYSAAFLDQYRAAQRARSQRITQRVWARLEALRAAGRPYDEEAFVVHGWPIRAGGPTVDRMIAPGSVLLAIRES